jgi:hypothetical protein
MVVVEEVGHTGLGNIGILEAQKLGGRVPFVDQMFGDTEEFAVPGLAVVLGIVARLLQPIDPSALRENQGPGGLEVVELSVVPCEEKKGLVREPVAKDQRRSLAEDTPHIVLVHKVDILAEWDHEENMAESAGLDNSPTFGREGVAFGWAVAAKVHEGGHY